MKAKTWCMLFVGCALLVAAGIAISTGEEAAAVDTNGYTLTDRNGDGVISDEEFDQMQALAEEVMTIDFSAADDDGDGNLTPAEYEGYLSYLEEEEAQEKPTAEEGEEEESDVDALEDILSSSITSDEEADEVEKLRAALVVAKEPDVVNYVLARPKVYPFAYRTLVRWARRYPKHYKWARTVHAHRKRHPGPAVPRRVRPRVRPRPRPRRRP